MREVLKPRVETLAEALPGVSPTVIPSEYGPAGHGFHGILVVFDIPRSENCPANIKLQFGLDAGPDIENVILNYHLEILPVYAQFEREDRLVLPLEPASVDRAVDWFDQKALQFTRTYIELFFNPHYQRGIDVPDVVLRTTFPRLFAKGEAEYNGKTYYFFTEESRRAFEQDPTRYLGHPDAS